MRIRSMLDISASWIAIDQNVTVLALLSSVVQSENFKQRVTAVLQITGCSLHAGIPTFRPMIAVVPRKVSKLKLCRRLIFSVGCSIVYNCRSIVHLTIVKSVKYQAMQSCSYAAAGSRWVGETFNYCYFVFIKRMLNIAIFTYLSGLKQCWLRTSQDVAY